MLTQLKFMTGIKNPATDEPNVTIPFSSLLPLRMVRLLSARMFLRISAM